MLGGIENYMLNLASQLVDMGHDPIVFCESDHNGEERVNGFRVIYMKGPKSNLVCKPWVSLKATMKCVLSIRHVDFIHYNAWPPSLCSPLARLSGIRSLMQGHGLEWQRSKYSPTAQKVMRFMEWLTAHLNRNLIMCSDDQTRYFRQHYGREAVTIPTAINLPDFEKCPTSGILERNGLEKGRFFLFLARLVQDKNPNDLISAFNKAKIKGYKLVIAGNNPSNEEYVRHLHALAQGNPDIVFTGAVYGDDKEMLLRNAFAFCIPSTIEGLSISLLEAMSYRLPVIASDIPANREVLEEDKAVWVRPENVEDLVSAFQRIVSNAYALNEIIEYNYNKVKDNYTWDKVAMKYLATVKSFLGN